MSSRETPEQLMERLRRGKEELRAERRALPLPEKVRIVVELQRIALPLIARRRALRPHERVWDLSGE